MKENGGGLAATLAAGALWGAVAGLSLCALELLLTFTIDLPTLDMLLGPAWPWLLGLYAAFGLVAGVVAALVLSLLARPLGIAAALAEPHGAFAKLVLLVVPFYVLFVYLNDEILHPNMNPPVLILDALVLIAAGYGLVRWLRVSAGRSSRLARGALIAVAALALLTALPPLISGGVEKPRGGVAATAEHPFNVLFVTIDTLRAGQLGCYGYPRPTSPVIDRLAAEGVRLADARTVSTQTDPSHATMLTGLFPTSHGLVRNGWQLPARNVTLAEALRAAHYRTFAAVSVQHLSSHFGFDQGFERFRNVSPFDRFHLYGRSNHSFFSIPILLRSDLIAEIIGRPLVRNYRRASHATDDFLDWFEAYDGKSPFFAWVHYFDPHAPYEPPDGWLGPMEAHPPALADVFTWDEGAVRRFDRYDAEVAYADSQLGRMVEAIEARGLGEKTLIVVTADHGELLGERGARGHNGTAYEEVLHVPWVMRLPGYLPSGAVMEWPASLVDVTPTLLAFLGVPAPGALEGAVLPLPVPGLAERKLPDRAILARTETWDEELHLAAIEGDFKSIESRLVPSGDILAAPALFDLGTDPYELHDLALAEPGRLARLREALQPMLVTVEGQGPVDEQTKGVLRALGYVQ